MDMAIKKGKIIIAGKKEIGCNSAKQILEECKNSHFMREITVPDGVTIDDITAEYVYGILTIHIPKKKGLLNESAMKAYDKQLTENSLKISG